MSDNKYKDVLYDSPNLDYEETRQNFLAAINGASEKDIDKMLEKSLRQPIMAEVYAVNGIEPQEVDNYIEKIKASPIGHKKTMLTGFNGAYGKAAISDYQENQPKINGVREGTFSLFAHLSVEAITSPMKEFVEERRAAEQKEEIGFATKVNRLVKKYMPNFNTLVAGSCVVVAVTSGLKQMCKIRDKEDAAKLTAKSNTADKKSKTGNFQLNANDFKGHNRV